ncbi:MAG: cytochrome c [Acidobacteriota bacterium]
MKTNVKVLRLATALAAALLLIPADSNAQGGGGKGGGKGKAAETSNPNAPPPKMGPVNGNVANGRELFHAHGCYGCHGFNGETGARDLVGTNSVMIATEEAFIGFLRLRADQSPVAPSTRMPNFPKAALSDTAARDIYAYVRSFQLNAPAIEDVPTLTKILESADRPYKP